MPDTNELVLAAQGGDEKAFTQLMLRHSGYVRNLARRCRISEGEIDDVLQQVFWKVWQRLSDFRGDASFLTWLYRIALNMCIDHIRKAKRKAECEYDDTVEQSRHTSAHVYSQSERLWAEQATVAIDSAVAGLTAAHAQILTLSHIEGLSYEDIANHLGIPKGTVMSRLFHARHNTQRALLEKGIIPHSSTQKVGRREVGVMAGATDVESALRSSWVQRIERMTGLRQALWVFARAFYREHNKGQWFGVLPQGYRYPFVAKEDGGHEKLLEVVEILKQRGYFTKGMVRRTRQPLWQFTKSLEAEFCEPTAVRNGVEIMSPAPTTVRKMKKSSPEVRGNDNSPPEEGKAPAMSGKEENNVPSNAYQKFRAWVQRSSQNKAELLRQIARFGGASAPGVLSSELMPQIGEWALKTLRVTLTPRDIGNVIRYELSEYGYVDGSGKTSEKRWWVNASGHEVIVKHFGESGTKGDTDTDTKKAETEAEAADQANAVTLATEAAKEAKARTSATTQIADVETSAETPSILPDAGEGGVSVPPTETVTVPEAVEDPTDDDASDKVGAEVEKGMDIRFLLGQLSDLRVERLGEESLRLLVEYGPSFLGLALKASGELGDRAATQQRIMGEKFGLRAAMDALRAIQDKSD